MNHLPTVFTSQECYNSSYIRSSPRLELGQPRLLSSVAFAYLDPITELSKEEFFVPGSIASVVGAIKTHSSLGH